jgi:hypothetical protein
MTAARIKARYSARRPVSGRSRPEDTCGCVMGARFLAAALLISTAWYAWRWQATGMAADVAIFWVGVWSFAAAFVGKLVGIVAARLRNRRRVPQPAATHPSRFGRLTAQHRFH